MAQHGVVVLVRSLACGDDVMVLTMVYRVGDCLACIYIASRGDRDIKAKSNSF